MKIRILDAGKMRVPYENGEVVEVFWIDTKGGWGDSRYFSYAPNWKDKYFEFVEEKDQEDMHGYKEAWQTVWDSICKNCPEDLYLDIMTSGTGIENAVEFVEVMSRHYKESTKEKASKAQFKVGDRVRVIADEDELLATGCDESVQSGEVYTVKEVSEDLNKFSFRLDSEDTCSWVDSDSIEITKIQHEKSTLQNLQDFTTLNKDIEISFEAGKILVRDWSGSCDPIEHAVDSLEDLEEIMGAFEVFNKYRG